MSTLDDYNGLEVVVDPEPGGEGGLAINNNFKKISTKLTTTSDPNAGVPDNTNDESEGYGVGSRWINKTTKSEYVCTANTTDAAEWLNISPLLAAQNNNRVLAGPETSGSAAPTFRTLVVADIPSLPGTQIGSGTVAAARLASSGTPSSSNFLRGDSSWATLSATNIPDLATSKITSGTFSTARLGSGSASDAKFLRGDGTWSDTLDGTLTCSGISMGSGLASLYQITTYAGISVGGSMSVNGDIEITGEIRPLRAENSSGPPGSASPGQIYFDTHDGHFYGYNGSSWVQLD